MHHKASASGKLAPTKAGDKAVEDLNSASLDSAKSGKAFTPPATPPEATTEGHEPAAKKPMKHTAKKKTESAAPADTGSDSSK
jgi:hypothetical protein